jgi:hypothetical protein
LRYIGGFAKALDGGARATANSFDFRALVTVYHLCMVLFTPILEPLHQKMRHRMSVRRLTAALLMVLSRAA